MQQRVRMSFLGYDDRQCTMTIALLSLGSVSIVLSIVRESRDSVESVGMTVSDMDRAVEFYSALTFQKVSDIEVLGDEFEHLEGVFGARMRIVRMQLGNEFLDLTQYLAPPGRPIPADSRSNDLWFQHIAIVVRDMDEAFQQTARSESAVRLDRPTNFAAIDQGRCRNQSVLFSRSRSAQPGDHLFSAGQRRSAMAGEDRQAISRYRSHRHWHFKHGCES